MKAAALVMWNYGQSNRRRFSLITKPQTVWTCVSREQNFHVCGNKAFRSLSHQLGTPPFTSLPLLLTSVCPQQQTTSDLSENSLEHTTEGDLSPSQSHVVGCYLVRATIRDMLTHKLQTTNSLRSLQRG